MSNPFVGEVRLFGGNFAPMGWAFCQGQLMPIAENEVLFQLIGTTYGGDGVQTFALPDLSGRVPVHQGQGPGLTGRPIGQMAGRETVTLSYSQMPAHSHALRASTAAASVSAPAGALLAATPVNSYDNTAAGVPMAAGGITTTGGSTLPHDNMAPSLALNYIISLYGIFPSPS
ncbi:phage tail protein [Roseateles sp.]|uniref:phage tail protein n=1 Tax=Roseateles sp. TaxID=1971397 RepID=UPI002E00CC09|nr:tail fiber protein [Roseateles sp.]